MTEKEKPKPLTISQKINDDGLPKPGELIEIKQAHELTLQDWRIFDRLLELAWPDGAANLQGSMVWTAPLSAVTLETTHNGGSAVRESIDRLMATRVQVSFLDRSDNEKKILKTVLVSGTITTADESLPSASLQWSFSPQMVLLLQNSNYWGRVRSQVSYAFASKYAYRLYQWVALKINLHRSIQEISPDALREMLAVPNGKYEKYPQFNQSVIQPALQEVNALSDFNVLIEPMREGGKQRGDVIKYRLEYWRKSADERAAATAELNRHKKGRRERLKNDPLPMPRPVKETTQAQLDLGFTTASGGLNLSGDIYEKARKKGRDLIHGGIDVYAAESAWKEWVGEKKIVVKNPDAHFMAFLEQFANGMKASAYA
jgi:hypothetical protein